MERCFQALPDGHEYVLLETAPRKEGEHHVRHQLCASRAELVEELGEYRDRRLLSVFFQIQITRCSRALCPIWTA